MVFEDVQDLLSSWIVESSGLLVGSHAGLRVRDERWDARNLCVGDLLRRLWLSKCLARARFASFSAVSSG